MAAKKAKKSKGKVRKKLTPHEIEKRQHTKEIRKLMTNMGFAGFPGVDGKHFTYDERQTEMDDFFYYENVVIFIEYTVGSPGSHLKEKKIFYDKANANHTDFIKFLLNKPLFSELKAIFDKNILSKYSINQLQVKFIYASKQSISPDHKILVKQVPYLDYATVKYFESISKVIKKSTKHEFFNFIDIDFSLIGENIKESSKSTVNEFSGHILPEDHSSFQEGYKIVSFYIDASSLIKRAYVLRKDGWRNNENIGLYQRMLVSNKIKSMRKYLHAEKRVFINNIIVTLPINEITISDEKGNKLQINESGNFINQNLTRVQPTNIAISNKANIIGIIDGQHRTYAYHEGDDSYEKEISNLRNIQNLLITGILFPQNEPEEKRIKFEAQLFLEINSNQSSASTRLKYDIEYMMNPFSTNSIAKSVISKLNEIEPLGGLLEIYWYDRSKIKTSSIISFGLKPLIKLDGTDSLFSLWPNVKKGNLKSSSDYDLLNEYRTFCVEQIRDILIGLRFNIQDKWKADRKLKDAILNVTTINGVINCLRLLIQNNKTGNMEYYKRKFSDADKFPFKKYKSSQYGKMGEDLYNKFFKT